MLPAWPSTPQAGLPRLQGQLLVLRRGLRGPGRLPSHGGASVCTAANAEKNRQQKCRQSPLKISFTKQRHRRNPRTCGPTPRGGTPPFPGARREAPPPPPPPAGRPADEALRAVLAPPRPQLRSAFSSGKRPVAACVPSPPGLVPAARVPLAPAHRP